VKLLQRARDRVIVQEVKTTYAKVPIRPGDVVLDLGANIGAAALLMLEKGAAKVIGVEPDPTNLALARRNLPKRKATLIWAAVGSKPGRTTFWLRPDKPYLSSRMRDDGRVPLKVPMVTLGGLLAHYKPSVVKCDIEFGEYDLPELRDLPKFVRALALEVHVRHDLVLKNGTGNQREDAASLIAAIEAQGFRQVWRRDKQAKAGPVKDETGLGPLVRSVDAIWER
jgi:FkbM family methyltransferase